jgi:hypothetical protein
MVAVFHTLRRTVENHRMAQLLLLGCGIAAAVWWTTIDVVVSLWSEGYSYTDQTISELSAEGTPTRMLMLMLSSVPYTVLLIAFGVGVWVAAGRTLAGRITGAVLVGEAVFGLLGGVLFPMAPREVIAVGEDTLRNQIHAPYGIGMPILFLLIIGFGSTLLGKRFRWYSYGTILIMLVFGLLVSFQAPGIEANEPTPWIGVEERVTAYVPMLWFVVLAIGLLRAQGVSLVRRLGERTETAPMIPR